jgi:hypothetical protein
MMIAATICVLFAILGSFCIAAYARQIEHDFDEMRADYEDALEVNQVLVKALAQQTNTAADTRTVLDMVSSALGHSLNGDNDSAWAILGELGDTNR